DNSMTVVGFCAVIYLYSCDTALRKCSLLLSNLQIVMEVTQSSKWLISRLATILGSAAIVVESLAPQKVSLPKGVGMIGFVITVGVAVALAVAEASAGVGNGQGPSGWPGGT